MEYALQLLLPTMGAAFLAMWLKERYGLNDFGMVVLILAGAALGFATMVYSVGRRMPPPKDRPPRDKTGEHPPKQGPSP